MYDLVVIGAQLAGVSLADDARRAGVDRVLVLSSEGNPIMLEILTRLGIETRLGVERAQTVETSPGTITVDTSSDAIETRALVRVGQIQQAGRPGYALHPALEKRVHFDTVGFETRDQDVLVVGTGDRVVELLMELVRGGARPVLSLVTPDAALSRLGMETLLGLEHKRDATVLWHTRPDSVEEVGSFAMAYFDDRGTPDLQFDHVIYSIPDRRMMDSPGMQEPRPVGVRMVLTVGAMPDLEIELDPAFPWPEVQMRAFPELLPHALLTARTGLSPEDTQRLRLADYNATITHFDRAHNELWILRVKPDSLDVSHLPGQYATLGLGYWEPRVDDADEQLTSERAGRMIRRSYSISSRVFDPRGYLIDPGQEYEVELYIVHVQPQDGQIPALTPRLAAKHVGDRIYLGPKIAGRYTLTPVDDPALDVVFIATGTGEAPHNAMITELLRRGHHGAMLSLVTVRYEKDLAYLDTYLRLAERFPNFQYLPIITRGTSSEKRYVQDYIRSGEIMSMLPHRLDPDRTHVFLCGNPAMIGRPDWDDDLPLFPQPEGVCQLLHDLGFTIDRRGRIGNVHQEEYW